MPEHCFESMKKKFIEMNFYARIILVYLVIMAFVILLVGLSPADCVIQIRCGGDNQTSFHIDQR